jgi:carbon-monoxide dehydrogenase medium subunit
MKPASFDYHRPDSLEEALVLLKNYGEDAKMLAGGQSLVPAMNFRVVQPAVLIDLNQIQEMDYVRQNNGSLSIGAMTRERRLELDPLIARHLPLLTETMPNVAHPQIRNRGTLGGSLSHADPAAELPVVMLALGARLKARNGGAERWITAPDFFKGMFTTDLAPDEILVEIEIPFMGTGTGSSFMEVAPRAGDYALMGVAAVIQLDKGGNCTQARLVYLNAGEGPIEAKTASTLLTGNSLDDSVIEASAQTASQDEIQPFGNLHASADFQRHLARELTIRTLKQAIARAGKDHLQ